jgi:hypothetical protein
VTELRVLRRAPHVIYRLRYKCTLCVDVVWLKLRNIFGRRPITHAGGPVVSLTSYGERIRTVHLAIESIGRGQIRPSRILLWLDDPLMIEKLSAGIRRLQSRGLEVRLCEDLGPHKKYYPYLESSRTIEVPLVTADDDVLYPSYWLQKLVQAHRQFPNGVNCYRARQIALGENGLAKYETWKPAESTDPSFCHCAIGVGGVIYPVPLQYLLKEQGTAFIGCCPRADDVWLHVQALRAGYKVRQIDNRCFELRYIPGTQTTALYHCNLDGGANDRQIRNTYKRSDFEALRLCRVKSSALT